MGPRSGGEKRGWSPPPAMGRRRGGHPHSRVLLEACWVRHPMEWGGEENVVPPRPRWAGGAVDPAMRGLVDGGMLGWTPHGVGWRGECGPPRPRWAGGAVDTRIARSCWWHVGLDTPRSGVEKRMWSPPPAMGRRRGGHPLCGVLLVACWVRHPTELGGEENVVPPC